MRILALALLLTGCTNNPLVVSPKDIPKGASYLGCADTSNQLNGTFYAGTLKGFRCTKIGTGFDDVKKITTPAGTLEFD